MRAKRTSVQCGGPGVGRLTGLCLLGLLLSGCAAGSPTLNGYHNRPLGLAATAAESSGAYLASAHVPWCVNLRHPSLTVEQALAFRAAFYRLSHDHGAARRSTSSPAPRGVRIGDVGPGTTAASCWAVARATDAGIDGAVHDRNLLALALPGGGSRSAVFSAAVMFELQREGLLQEVDFISSVSGGSMPAALFARSCEDDAECRALMGGGEALVWRPEHEERVFDLLTTNFLRHGIVKIAMPWNQVLYRTTRYDRTDTMAEVFASTLFSGAEGRRPYGMTFRDLNPRRPNLIINAVNSSGHRLAPGLKGQHFHFTLETFEEVLHSDLHDYPLAFAVAGSGAFPGAFHPLTLAKFSDPLEDASEREAPVGYVHIVDGGLYDRLGGETIRSVLEEVTSHERFCVGALSRHDQHGPRDCLDRVVLIVLDSGLPIRGEDTTSPDVRIPLADLFTNHNIEMASFALLDIQAELRLDSLKAFIRARNGEVRRAHGVFTNVFDVVEVRLRDLERCVSHPLPCARAEGRSDLSFGDARRSYQDLWEAVVEVPVSLRISHESAMLLRRAARILVSLKLHEHCLAADARTGCMLELPQEVRQAPTLYTGSPPR